MLRVLSRYTAGHTAEEIRKMKQVFVGSPIIFWFVLSAVYWQFETIENARLGVLLCLILPLLPILSLVEGFFRLILPHERVFEKTSNNVWRLRNFSY